MKNSDIHAYCANEMWSGYPCGLPDCPHCGGDIEGTKEFVANLYHREDTDEE